MHILLTGAAGFVGSHTARMFLERGDFVTGLDSFNDYLSKSWSQLLVDGPCWFRKLLRRRK